MGFDIGAALSYLGKAAPGIGQSFDDARRQREEDELKRQQVAAALKQLAQEGKINDQTIASNDYKQKRTTALDIETDTKKTKARRAYDSWMDMETKASGQFVGPMQETETAKVEQYKLKPSLDRMKQYQLPYHAAADEGIEKTLKAETDKEKEKTGLFAGWKKKVDERDAINAMPDGPEKDAAWDQWEKTWATSTYLSASDPYIGKAAKKAKEVQLAQIPGKTTEAAATSAAGTRAREETQREVQREQPMFSAEQANKVSQSAQALKNMQRIREALVNGNIDFFDRVPITGQFKNPKIANSSLQINEIVARGASGAAINKDEWKKFDKETLNRQFLLTEQGRKTALENLDDYIDRFYSNGELITADPEWYDKYNVRGKKGREKVSGDKGNSSSGGTIRLTGSKAARLEELRRKQASGELK
jgi:hypothetical protein